MLLALIIAGCSAPDLSDLERQIGEAAQPSTRGAPEALRHVVDSFKYGAMTERSPFEPFAEIPGGRASGAPDPARARHPAEIFTLGQLEMVGTLRGRGRDLALIRDPDGTTHPLGVGDYLGRDHGRVTTVHESRIDILELVEDGNGAWIQRPRALELSIPEPPHGPPAESKADHRNGGTEG